ncbi:CoA-binding protein [Comamonas antarctica]|uniref:CoA-binding protein n=1 Tax=Comamonas antarctica TaxID=2743470 RepID=UPI0028EA7AEC|nr:CoA-binding protein [Comamonas antarctica]
MHSLRETVYSHGELAGLLAPRSVAIIGASSRPGSFGERTLRNLRAHYTGRVYLINPQYATLGADPCYPDLAALPEVPDCAVIAVPREKVYELVAQCVEAQLPGVLVFASGYAETDQAEGLNAQRALSALVRGSKTRLVGPNCLGFANYAAATHLSFSEFPGYLPGPAAVGIASQSGALAMAIAQGANAGTPISHALACGNMVDVDVADYVSYMAGESACAAIVCIIEGHEHPARMEQAARIALAAGKPLIVHKLGCSAKGIHAAWRHTASVAGSQADWQALFARCGAVMVEHFDRVLEVASFFAKAPRAGGRGAAILSTSGGACIIAADAAAAHGIELPPPADAANAQVLADTIPAFGYPHNPFDTTAQVISHPASFSACAAATMGDAAYDCVVTPHIQAYESATPRIATLNEQAARFGKIACNVWLTQWMGGPGYADTASLPHIALFRSMDSCFWTLARWQQRQQWIDAQSARAQSGGAQSGGAQPRGAAALA